MNDYSQRCTEAFVYRHFLKWCIGSPQYFFISIHFSSGKRNVFYIFHMTRIMQGAEEILSLKFLTHLTCLQFSTPSSGNNAFDLLHNDKVSWFVHQLSHPHQLIRTRINSKAAFQKASNKDNKMIANIFLMSSTRQHSKWLASCNLLNTPSLLQCEILF